jgi:hypothetical protein
MAGWVAGISIKGVLRTVKEGKEVMSDEKGQEQKKLRAKTVPHPPTPSPVPGEGEKSKGKGRKNLNHRGHREHRECTEGIIIAYVGAACGGVTEVMSRACRVKA